MKPHFREGEPVICSNRDEDTEATVLSEMSQPERQILHGLTCMLDLKNLTTRNSGYGGRGETWSKQGDVGGDSALSVIRCVVSGDTRHVTTTAVGGAWPC